MFRGTRSAWAPRRTDCFGATTSRPLCAQVGGQIRVPSQGTCGFRSTTFGLKVTLNSLTFFERLNICEPSKKFELIEDITFNINLKKRLSS